MFQCTPRFNLSTRGFHGTALNIRQVRAVAKISMDRMAEPEEIAQVVLFLPSEVTTNHSSFMLWGLVTMF